jgi:hypothetical protein
MHCRSREPGRLYCDDCREPAQKERERRARKTYRATDYGQEQHRDEEAERRERLGVGDRRCAPVQGRLQLPATVVLEHAAREQSDAASRSSNAVEWLVVAWPGLVAMATRLVGTTVACPCCERAGLIARILPLEDWKRRRLHRGCG